MSDGNAADGSDQAFISNRRGYVNVVSDTWHYLDRCAGECRSISRVSLAEAIDEGYDLCGVCADRFECYVNTGSEQE